MGTPVACSYAMLSFSHHENNNILTEFQPNLLFYKRYIDDILGIWIPSENNNISDWDRFKKKLNDWGSLKWVIEDPSYQTQFLDLHIKLQNATITTETYQKSMNLYLYIPPLSAHPQSCFKGLIHGELRRYWIQNNPFNFQTILLKFIQRLTDRGHTIEQLTPLLMQAAVVPEPENENQTMQQDTTSQTESANNSSKEQNTHPLLITFEDELDKLGKHPTFDDNIQEYMHWHYRLNHASFPTMLQMAKQKHLPQGISAILKRMERQRHKPPLCSDCIASKMCRKQWRQKQEKEREIKPNRKLLPGDIVSVDQLVSSTPGLVACLHGGYPSRRIGCRYTRASF